MTDQPYVPFSQRNGFANPPPQLKLKEVSADLRRLLHYAVFKDMESEARYGSDYPYFGDRWEELALDLWVRHVRRSADTFENKPSVFHEIIKQGIERGKIGEVFDLVEFIIKHPKFDPNARADVSRAFVDSRAAYRVVDNLIVAIGTEEQAAAFEHAIAEASAKNVPGARKHLINAGMALRNGDWTGSVRESIHSVESVATSLAPGESTLGAALKAIEKRGHLHGALKAAFEKLYGYSSDEKGVRHALVFDDEAKVDEADALFMLGACASFVSYLLARTS